MLVFTTTYTYADRDRMLVFTTTCTYADRDRMLVFQLHVPMLIVIVC
jgi:hypothetical protein